MLRAVDFFLLGVVLMLCILPAALVWSFLRPRASKKQPSWGASALNVTALARHMAGQLEGRPLESQTILRLRTGKPLLMHVHLPKTSGTHLIWAMRDALCDRPLHTGRLGATCMASSLAECPATLLDTSLYCLRMPRMFHEPLDRLERRAVSLAARYSSPLVVYVTTLRPPLERLASHWLHFERMCSRRPSLEIFGRPVPCSSPHGKYAPPPLGVTMRSNASFLHFVHAAHARNDSNLQLKFLTSGEAGSSKRAPDLERRSQTLAAAGDTTWEGFARRVASEADLEAVKRTLLGGHPRSTRDEKWLVGFTGCTHRLLSRLVGLNVARLSPARATTVAPLASHLPAPPSSPPAADLHATPLAARLRLSAETVGAARRLNHLDEQLYRWAREQSATSPDRFCSCSADEEAASYRRYGTGPHTI